MAPMLAAPPSDEQAYAARLQECGEIVAGKRKGSGVGTSAAGGAAAGAGAAAAATAATSAATFGFYGAAAAAGAAVITLVPVVGILGAWGISKVQRGKRERAFKAAMTQCLGDSGYAVAGWRFLSKEELRAAREAAKAAKTPESEPDPSGGS